MADPATARGDRAAQAGYLPEEARVLLLSVAAAHNDAALAALLERVDLARLYALATEEKAVDPVWRRIGAPLGDRRSEPSAVAMSRTAMVGQFRMTVLRQRLRESVAALVAAEVPVVLLKGAALATAVYPAFHDRPMGDLDLLVPEAAVKPALAALRQAGWRFVDGEGEDDERYARHHHLPMLVDSSGAAAPLELHVEILPEGHPFRFGAADLWARAVPAPGIAGALVPHPTDQLLHCAVHFVWSHEGRSGGWRALRDVGAIVDRGVDWDGFVAAATAAGAASCGYWTLRLAATMARVPVPPAVLAALRPHRPEWRLRALERHFALQLFSSTRTCPSVRLAHRLWEAAVDPVGSGHGAARPWMWDELFLESPGGASPGAAGRVLARVAGQVRRGRDWSGYLSALLAAR